MDSAKGVEMRMGRVYLERGYVVDLDNPNHVSLAKELLWEDLEYFVKFPDDFDICVSEAEDGSLSEAEIDSIFTEFDKETL